MEFKKRGSKQRNGVLGCPYAKITKIGVCIINIIISLTLIIGCARAEAAVAPAVFVFGDSLADVGNNNYLPLSLAKGNYPHNGVDFPTHKPTGRFSNGKNAADFIAEMLGLASPPPYLYMLQGNMSNFQTGVNFASAGAGIFNGTGQYFIQVIPMTKQIEYYSTVRDKLAVQLGETDLKNLQEKAIHAIIVGSNDILAYATTSSNFSTLTNPTQFVDLMVYNFKAQVQLIYDSGGRKFVMAGVPAVGCCPQQRLRSLTSDCYALANAMATDYNKGLRLVLEDLSSRLQGFHYTYFDTYAILLDFIQNPQVYGFKEVKAACCGSGILNAVSPCIPVSTYCPNRNDHLFWDFYHPSEAAARFAIDVAFNDTQRYSYPININQLASI